MPVAAENGAEPFMLDDYVVKQPSRTVMIPIKGDSMIDAGIHSGDIAVVERGTGASKGDFVVAIVDNEFTLKELGMERGRFILIPAQPGLSGDTPAGRAGDFRRHGRAGAALFALNSWRRIFPCSTGRCRPAFLHPSMNAAAVVSISMRI